MSVEYWWNDNDRVKIDVAYSETKLVSVPLRPQQITQEHHNGILSVLKINYMKNNLDSEEEPD